MPGGINSIILQSTTCVSFAQRMHGIVPHASMHAGIDALYKKKPWLSTPTRQGPRVSKWAASTVDPPLPRIAVAYGRGHGRSMDGPSSFQTREGAAHRFLTLAPARSEHRPRPPPAAQPSPRARFQKLPTHRT